MFKRAVWSLRSSRVKRVSKDRKGSGTRKTKQPMKESKLVRIHALVRKRPWGTRPLPHTSVSVFASQLKRKIPGGLKGFLSAYKALSEKAKKDFKKIAYRNALERQKLRKRLAKRHSNAFLLFSEATMPKLMNEHRTGFTTHAKRWTFVHKKMVQMYHQLSAEARKRLESRARAQRKEAKDFFDMLVKKAIARSK